MGFPRVYFSGVAGFWRRQTVLTVVCVLTLGLRPLELGYLRCFLVQAYGSIVVVGIFCSLVAVVHSGS